jgi:P27 family predicted phage terminase small subunit
MMPRGRKPTPVHLRVLRGNPHRRPIPNTPDPEISADVPEAPNFLYGHARDEWLRVTPELHHMRLLSKVDLKVLEAYCVAYGRWREAEEALASARETDPLTKGLIIKSVSGAMIESPLIYTSRKAAFEMLRFASEFGFTPASRARIHAGPRGADPKSKFGDLLA